ncbi:host specificity protein J [Corallococcus sp. AB030]|uniref:host specificity protein J n=1 Tax=Corallococcus sp. AB030 TaxID=2316716 RepID=UPI000EDCE38B|nr:phage tail protein [Corallococcus sp. AB030]RKI09700.1 host specificity protein J [Corallococcus sp. AB030]
MGGSSGGKGEGGAQRTPVESPNTLKSSSKARVLDLLCEGEIQGLVDGLKSVYLDGVAIQNPDGTFNFTGVTVYDVKGTQSQEYIPGFPSGEAEHSVGVEVKRATPVVRTVSDPEVDAVRVTLQVPQLTYQDPTTGDLKPTRVLVSIAVQSNGGGYVVQSFQDAELFRGKCTSPYERTFRVELTGSPPWDIRVTRVSEDADSVTTQNKVIWKSYATLLDEKLSFPNTALCALQVAASQFSSIPTRSYRIRGLRVRVPSNYSPVARTYEGTWDGTWKVAWTDNPAWCFYDLLTTKRYGLGRYLNEAAVDKWGLYTVAKYCDELVPDGKGGTEPRFRCNLYLQTQEDAYKVINNLASVFRCMTYWASGAVFVAQDAPRDAEYLFTPANVVDGLFTYASSGKRARHTVALVTWNDPDNHFKAAQEYVTDEEGLATYGYNPTEVVALGCTSRGQAQRVGRWLLLTERLETETVTFRTGFEGAMRNPGAVVKLQDPYRAGRRWGGRVVAATASQVELDADVTLEAGKTYALSVVLPDGTVEERPLAALAPAPYRALPVATPFSAVPQLQAVWVLAASDLTPTLWRILNVAEVEPHLYEITALRHEPGKYAEVEYGVKLQPLPTSVLPSSAPPAGLAVGESLYKTTNGGVKVMVTARWTQVATATEYRVRWQREGGNWTSETPVQTHYWELLDCLPGAYTVQVAAVLNGLVTTYASASYTVQGKAAPPSNVTGLTCALNGSTATLRWAEVPDLDRDTYELRYGASWEAGTLIGKVRATTYEWALPAPGVNLPVHVKAIDTSGNYSTGAASVLVVSVPTVPATLTLGISSTPPP